MRINGLLREEFNCENRNQLVLEEGVYIELDLREQKIRNGQWYVMECMEHCS